MTDDDKKKLTVGINARETPYETYETLSFWKKLGKFARWETFLTWLTTNKSVSDVIKDELSKTEEAREAKA